ncbi:hypothetical protein Hanom_Chr10g00962791 [Helianthus anomalus]
MPVSSLRFGQFCDFRPKVCFSAFGSKRFGILPLFIRLINPIHFSPLSQGYFCLFPLPHSFFSVKSGVFLSFS